MTPRLRTFLVTFGLVLVVSLFTGAAAEAATTAARTSGKPASPNGASSMHLWWQSTAPTQRVAVDLEVLDAGATSDLRYWALQIAFVDRAGKTVGGAHLGLQRHRHAPLGAVNWGGYRADGRGTIDSTSKLRSVTGSPNTFQYPWQVKEQHELVIEGRGDGWWTASIVKVATGARTEIGRLRGGGTALARPVVWSEVFAGCEAPAAARWSGFEPALKHVQATYQSHADGGCTNSNAVVDAAAGGVVQKTATVRTTPHGALLTPLP